MTPEEKKQKSKERYAKWYSKNKESARASKAANMRRYRKQNPIKHQEQSRRSKRLLREKLHAIYGTSCVLCGFLDIRALTLDHVLKNGASERAQLGERGVYRRALLPEHQHEYRCLCMNCQFIARS
jgi:hypothetical protein